MNTSNELTNQGSPDCISEQSSPMLQDAETLDPQQTKLEVAALAAHLQRAGVHWLPQANLQASEQIAAKFPAAIVKSASSTVSDANPETRVNPENATGPPARGTPTPDADADAVPAAGGKNNPGPLQPVTRLAPNRPATVRPATRLEGVAAIHATASEYVGESLATDQRILQLKQLEESVAACRLCPALTSCRTKTVFGEGTPSPRIAFFGEGPGEEEDATGRPFVGRAGELLTKMMQACTLERDDVYILNTVKCRPPGNRNPEGDELANCRSNYEQQFNLLRPEYVVCLGAVSAQELLGTKLSVGRLRGTLHQYFASKVLVTYHPAYLLRNPAAKKAAWADLQMLMRDAGIKPPTR